MIQMDDVKVEELGTKKELKLHSSMNANKEMRDFNTISQVNFFQCLEDIKKKSAKTM